MVMVSNFDCKRMDSMAVQGMCPKIFRKVFDVNEHRSLPPTFIVCKAKDHSTEKKKNDIFSHQAHWTHGRGQRKRTNKQSGEKQIYAIESCCRSKTRKILKSLRRRLASF